ncbi:MAG: type VI secretion system tube protein Hcp [Bacteroidales bacterium]|nr:type VI secretion system tube protein Hcp [Bacteroidales bacterium]
MKKIALLFLCGLGLVSLHSQNIAVTDDSTYTADQSAMLDIKSNNKGMLVPRMTFSQREAIISPAKGLLIYQTDQTEGFYVNQGTPAAPSWTGLTSGTNNLWRLDSMGTATILSDPDQRVGIGTSDPQARLSANGMVQSVSGGFKFPDGTVQTTASENAREESGAAEGRWWIAMECSECPGSWQIQGYEGCSQVFKLEWGLQWPFDGGTGQITGSRELQALTVTKNIDKATVCYIQKCDQGSNIPSIKFKFIWFDPPTGNIQEYYKIELTNCRVVDLHHDIVYMGNERLAHMDVISILYEEILWQWIPDQIIHQTTWIPPP